MTETNQEAGFRPHFDSAKNLNNEFLRTLNEMRRYARHFNDRRQLKRRSGKRQECWLVESLVKSIGDGN